MWVIGERTSYYSCPPSPREIQLNQDTMIMSNLRSMPMIFWRYDCGRLTAFLIAIVLDLRGFEDNGM